MKVKRDELLAELQTVQAGLSIKETTEQSDCFAFQNGEVLTFNDKVACRTESSLKIDGAVNAKKFLEMLSKWPEETIEFNRTKGRLNFKGKAKRGYFVTQDKVALPIQDVETPSKWKKLSENFLEGVKLVQGCASRASESSHLSCIHLTADWIEACDGVQAGRYTIKLPFKKRSILVQKEALQQIMDSTDVSVGLTKNWIHFKDKTHTISCRVHLDKYPSDRITKIFATKGNPTVLPKGLKNLVDRLTVFADDGSTGGWLVVEVTTDHIQITGKGDHGSQTERKKVKYKGEPIKFSINPKLFRDLTDKNTKCEITKRVIKVNVGDFQYATGLWVPKDEEE
jgi:DNA polymerase III sliding clamp (beta) subunit (PCNA family)